MEHASEMMFAETPICLRAEYEFMPDAIEILAWRKNRVRNGNKIEKSNHLSQRPWNLGRFYLASCCYFLVQDRIGLQHFRR